MSLKCYLYFSNCIKIDTILTVGLFIYQITIFLIDDYSNTECSPVDLWISSCTLLVVCNQAL